MPKMRNPFSSPPWSNPQREREAYLRSACKDDPESLKRVKVLLSVHDELHGPLDVQVSGVEPAFTTDLPITEGPGTVIGSYKLREQIGEGGFGLVFMAEQQEPIRRKVAIKVIKPGMDTQQVIARLEAERRPSPSWTTRTSLAYWTRAKRTTAAGTSPWN